MRIISNRINLKFEDFGSLLHDNNPFILFDIINSEIKNDLIFNTDGVFVYKLSYLLNIEKVLSNKISGINIKILNKDNNNELFEENIYFSEDFSTNKLTKDNKFSTTLIGDIQNKNNNNFEKSTITSKKETNNDNFIFELKSREIIAKNLDPSILLNKVKPDFSLPSSILSKASLLRDDRENEQNLRVIDTKKEKKSSLLENFRKVNFDNILNKEIRELKNSIKDFNFIQTEVPLTQVTKIKNDFIICHREIEIDKRILGEEEFYILSITPFTNNQKENKTKVLQNILFKETKYSFEHKKQVLEFSNFISEPKIKCINNINGVVDLEVQNQDIFPRKFNLYYKVFNSKINKFSKSILIDGFYFLPGETKIIKHNNSENLFPNKIFYKVSVVNDGMLSKFNTIIIDGNKNTNNTKTINKNSELSIVANNDFDGIKIEVSNIPTNIYNFKLVREDLGISGNYSDRVKIINYNNFSDVNVTGISKLSYLDKDVINNRKYRYYGMIKERLGKSFPTTDDDIIERISLLESFKNNIIIDSTQIDYLDNNKVNVNFDIKIENKNNGLDFIFELLKQSGYNEVYISELQKQKTDLNSLLSFIVERVDLLTGRKTSLGLTKPGLFIDNSLNEKTAINLKTISSYRYIFKLCLHPTDILLKETVTTIINNRNKTFEVSSKKFKSPITKRKGVILSKRQIEENNVDQQIKNSQIGIEITKDVFINNKTAIIKDLIVKENEYNNFCTISWKVDGNYEDLDYFIIYVDYLNNLFPIGTVSYDGNSKSFMFIDYKYFNEVGEKKYKIKMIYNDFSSGEFSEFVSSTKNYNLPENFVNSSEFIGL